MDRRVSRLKRKKRIRKAISGTQEKPRLSVYRSAKHIYAQIIDDDNQTTLAAASTVEKDFEAEGRKTDRAKAVGELIGNRAKDKGISRVVFDRNGYLYHGRVKALSEGAREGGLNF
ncbi:MAG: 50S ribosomal protein L18 [Desulfobacteraceae bacterium]